MKGMRTACSIIALTLFIDGALALIGCFAYHGDIIERVYNGVGSTVILATGAAMLIVRLAMVCAIVLTIDEIRPFMTVHFVEWSIHLVGQMARGVVNISLYWIVFSVYRRHVIEAAS
jgi:hypothetical protein